MPILKKPAQPTQTQAPAQQKSAFQKAPKTDAFAERYNQTEANEKGAYVPPPPGQYNALITEAQYENEEPKEFAYLECTIVDNDELAGKTARIYFGFTNEDGTEGSGMPYFKSALTMLGFNDPIESIEQVKEILAEIAQNQMWVLIDVKKKGKYTNVYLSSVPADQDQKPSLD